MERLNVILDTDIANEIDDQFALAYLLKSKDKLNLQAITIAPFSGSGCNKTKDISEGTEESYETTLKILKMLNEEEFCKNVYKGATKYFFEDKLQENDGVKNLIEIANKNDYTVILAIGAITNVALALYQAPEIKDKIEVVWLGGNSFLCDKNNEFNFRQDVEAVRYVFESGVKLTVIPCKNVASYLTTTIYEIEHYLKDIGEIGQYFCEIFENCKKKFRKDESDKIGESKTLWDVSVVAYAINREWFESKNYSCPKINDDTSYIQTGGRHEITFVSNMDRSKIFKDFFTKMGY